MAGPIPRTRCSPSSDPNGPCAERSLTMRRASAGPTRGRRSSSAADADSTSTAERAPDGGIAPLPPAWRPALVDAATVASPDRRLSSRRSARSRATPSGRTTDIGVRSSRTPEAPTASPDEPSPPSRTDPGTRERSRLPPAAPARLRLLRPSRSVPFARGASRSSWVGRSRGAARSFWVPRSDGVTRFREDRVSVVPLSRDDGRLLRRPRVLRSRAP